MIIGFEDIYLDGHFSPADEETNIIGTSFVVFGWIIFIYNFRYNDAKL